MLKIFKKYCLICHIIWLYSVEMDSDQLVYVSIWFLFLSSLQLIELSHWAQMFTKTRKQAWFVKYWFSALQSSAQVWNFGSWQAFTIMCTIILDGLENVRFRKKQLSCLKLLLHTKSLVAWSSCCIQNFKLSCLKLLLHTKFQDIYLCSLRDPGLQFFTKMAKVAQKQAQKCAA